MKTRAVFIAASILALIVLVLPVVGCSSYGDPGYSHVSVHHGYGYGAGWGMGWHDGGYYPPPVVIGPPPMALPDFPVAMPF